MSEDSFVNVIKELSASVDSEVSVVLQVRHTLVNSIPPIIYATLGYSILMWTETFMHCLALSETDIFKLSIWKVPKRLIKIKTHNDQ